VQKPTQALRSVKDPGNTFDLNPKWSTTLPSLIYFSWDINRDHSSIKKIKYQSWYLKPSCGLEVQKPTQALQTVKGPGNTFDWNPKWAKTLPSLIYLSWDINRDPLHKQKIKYQCWYLTPCCGLEVQKPTHALKSVKGLANTFDWSTKWARTLPSIEFFSWVIYRDPPNPNIKVVFWDSSRHISGGAKGSRLLRMGYWKWRHQKRPWPEMTSHEVTGPEATS
jgi:hypothetical protein